METFTNAPSPARVAFWVALVFVVSAGIFFALLVLSKHQKSGSGGRSGEWWNDQPEIMYAAAHSKPSARILPSNLS
jgi:hypothetical protein